MSGGLRAAASHLREQTGPSFRLNNEQDRYALLAGKKLVL